MRPLIDADILLYEVGSVGGYPGDEEIADFSFLSAILDGKILDICDGAGGTEPPTLYLTGKQNFRDAVAVTKPYKGNRKDTVKPYHTNNLKVYMKNTYDVVEADGLEADDEMSIEQVRCADKGDHIDWMTTIICSRDKDLRITPGMHYGWECANQREFGPLLVDYEGHISFDAKKNKLTGTGMAFFYAQLLMGDPTDYIPGCPGIGPKKAYEILLHAEGDMWSAVRKTYKSKKLDDSVLLEQGQLLWMIRYRDEDGRPVMWELPD